MLKYLLKCQVFLHSALSCFFKNTYLSEWQWNCDRGVIYAWNQKVVVNIGGNSAKSRRKVATLSSKLLQLNWHILLEAGIRFHDR